MLMRQIMGLLINKYLKFECVKRAHVYYCYIKFTNVGFKIFKKKSRMSKIRYVMRLKDTNCFLHRTMILV